MLKPAHPFADTALNKSGRGYTFPNGVLNAVWEGKIMRKRILGASLGVLTVPALALGLVCAPMPALAEEPTSDASVLAADSGYVVDWTKCGTCVWSIDSNYTLTIKPADGAESGQLDGLPWTWLDDGSYEKIQKVKIEGSVKAPGTLAGAFSGLSSLEEVDLAGLDTSDVESMANMFSGDTKLSVLDLSGFDSSKVENTYRMFKDCSSLESLDLSGLNTSSANYMSEMFSGCTSLLSVKLGAGFSFLGKTNERLTSLPNGTWKSSADGKSYAADKIPNNIEATYTRATTPVDTEELTEGVWKSESWNSRVKTINYTFTLSQGGMVYISSLTSGMDALLGSLMYSDGTMFQAWPVKDSSVYGAFALPAGTYTFSMTGFAKSYGGNTSIKYTVYNNGASEDTIYEIEPNDGSADGHTIDGDATPIQIGRLFAGSFYSLPAGVDVDYYKFTVNKRTHLELGLITVKSMMFALEDANGNVLKNQSTGENLVAETEEGGSTDTIDLGYLDAGTYYVIVTSKSAEAFGSPYYGYVLPYTVTFSDVNSETPHNEDISWLASSGVSAGWTEKDGTRTFRPYNKVARADMAAFLYRLAGSPEYTAPSASPFKDCDVNTPHYKEICWLAEKGISEGWTVTGGKEFRPYATVARCDMAAFLYRLAGSPEYEAPSTSPFKDCNTKTPHYKEVCWLAGTGVSEGWTVTGGKEFRSYSDVARADMAAFLHRMKNGGLV